MAQKMKLERSGEPVYSELFEDITFQIENGFLQPGAYLPSENELGERYNISRLSVRTALQKLVENNLVEKLPGKGTAIKEGSVAPAEAKTRTIGMLNLHNQLEAWSENPFYGPILRGIEYQARVNNYSLFLNSLETPKDEFDFYRRLHPEKVDGFLLLGPVEEELVEFLRKITPRKPFCFIDHSPAGANANCVMSANLKGTCEATSHLIGLGHRKIAFIGWAPRQRHISLRLKGYRKALEDHGIIFDPGLVEDRRTEKGEFCQPMTRLLDSRPEITAVVCANDTDIAFPAIKAIRDKGLKVPEDISVVGYDDVYSARFFHPSLTTVAVDKKSMGEEAVKRLLALFENPFLAPRQIVVETKLVVRDSTAPPR